MYDVQVAFLEADRFGRAGGDRRGCGGFGSLRQATPTSASPQQAQQAVNNAFRALGSQSGVVLHISLGVTGTQLQQLAGKDGSSRLTAKAATDLAATSIVVDLNTGNGQALNKQAGTDPTEQFGLAVNVGTVKPASDDSPVELRYVDQTFYVRADLPTLLKDLDQNPSAASGFQKAVTSQAANNYVPGLATLGQGGWVSVPASALTGLLQGLGSGRLVEHVDVGAAAVAPAPERLQRATPSTPEPAPAEDARITRRRCKLKPFVEDVERLLPASLGSIPGASSVGKQINSAVGKMRQSEGRHRRVGQRQQGAGDRHRPQPVRSQSGSQCRSGSRSHRAPRSNLRRRSTPLDLSQRRRAARRDAERGVRLEHLSRLVQVV